MTSESEYAQHHVVENPGLIDSSLRSVENILQQKPKAETVQWRNARSKCPELTGDDHLLMFLRCEVFNDERAVKRLLKYWDKRVEIFGDEKAFLPLTLDGALRDDDQALTIGNYFFTGAKDSAGRTIGFLNPSKEKPFKYDRDSMVRAAWYFIHAGLEDLTTQQKGGVFVDCPRGARVIDFDRKLYAELLDSIKGRLPVRLAAIHICHPPALFAVVWSIGSVFLGERLRRRVQVHSGSDSMVLAALEKNGIPKSALPEELLGGDDQYDHIMWLKKRRSQGK